MIHSQIPLRRRDNARQQRGEVLYHQVDGELFGSAPEAIDARQGVIGDCYLLSSFSALARSAPELLRSLLTANGDGTYTARFHRRLDGGQFAAEAVVVDGKVPVRKSDGEPIYARSRRRGELWPLIAEKAYAAWKGGYDLAGEGGMVEQTLEELTGQPTRMLFVAEAQPESLWNLLVRATDEGWPAAVCTYGRHERPAIDDLGFHPNHILVFLGVHTWMGRRIVWLRDPFDTPACGSLVKPDPHRVYTLAWEHFLEYFAEVELNGSEPAQVKLPPFPSKTIREAIDHSYVFHPLAAKDKRALAGDFTRITVDAGATVALAGEPSKHMYLIQHGAAAIELPTGRGGKWTRVGVGHAGDQFGEIHALDGRPYGATLRALTPMALYRLSADKLRRWVARHPELEHRFRRRFDLQLRMLDWGKHQVTTINADNLLHAGHALHLRKGAMVFEEGQPADGVYLVVEGEVEAFTKVRGRRKRLARLSPGQIFGEVEVLARKARLTSAQALTSVKLMRLDLGMAAERMEHFDILQRQLSAIAERRERMRLSLKRHL